jgi:hypothetical protein
MFLIQMTNYMHVSKLEKLKFCFSVLDSIENTGTISKNNFFKIIRGNYLAQNDVLDESIVQHNFESVLNLLNMKEFRPINFEQFLAVS